VRSARLQAVPSERPSFLRSGTPLAAASVIGGLLTYTFVLVLSRALGPATYGSVGTLLGIAVIASVPASALQLELGRLVARGSSASRARLLRVSALVSVATMTVALLCVPLMDHLLRLSSPLDGVCLALLLLSQTFAGGLLGMLLGRNLMGSFSVVLVGLGVSRLASAVLTQHVGGGSTFALAAAAAATAIATALAVVLVLVRTPRYGGRTPAPTPRQLTTGLLRASGGVAAVLVLLNVDLILARVVLDDTTSGLYAFATFFGRVTFWGTSFLSLWIYPRIALSGHATQALRLALGIIAIVSGLVLTVSAVAGQQIVQMLVGNDYAAAAPYAPLFAAAGGLISVVQLAVYVDVARARHQVTISTWAAASAVVLTVFSLGIDSIGGLIGLDLCVLAVLALATLLLQTRQSRALSAADDHSTHLRGSGGPS
jgi:O-antigen/teichoic acid export membrane protein